MDKELKVLENKLLLTNKKYKLTREQSRNWVKYAVVREFPVGMPWEGTEEKKQKQGTSNARLYNQKSRQKKLTGGKDQMHPNSPNPQVRSAKHGGGKH
jgi:hypothetical protein